MSSATFVKVARGEWRFEPSLVFDYLKAAYPGRATWQGADPHQLMLEGFDDGWEVNLQDELATLVVEGPPAARVEVIACLRRHVPSDVELQMFDDQLHLRAHLTTAEHHHRRDQSPVLSRSPEVATCVGNPAMLLTCRRTPSGLDRRFTVSVRATA